MSERPLDRVLLEEALEALGEEAVSAGKVIDVAIYGGSSLVLATEFRVSTRDVDAVVRHDEEFVKTAADKVGKKLGLPDDWFNDGVKTYLAPEDRESVNFYGAFPNEGQPGVRIFIPTPEYLLAMKLMAMRIDEASGKKDLDDIVKLMSIAVLKQKEDVIGLASRFYPEARISAKLHLSIDHLWQEKERHERERGSPPSWKSRRDDEER